MERFAYNYQSKLENLPDSEKQRLKETFAKLSENNTEEILNEASSIIGINLLTNAKTINNKSEFLKRINSTNITKKDLTIAITKHNLTRKNTPIRLKSGSENSGGESGRSKCKKSCDASFIACAAAAALTPPPADIGVLALCIYAYDQCIGACNESEKK